MTDSNRHRKGEIKYKVQLNEEQKEAKRLIMENQIVVITGRAGCGKSLVCAQVALDYLNKKEVESILVTRATVEVGASLGFLPGNLSEKYNPYIEAFVENLYKCRDKVEIDKMVTEERIKAFPVQFIRGKTIDDILIVEEGQNLSKGEMLAILGRLGVNAKIIINGDLEQCDSYHSDNGLTYAIWLSKKLTEVKWIKLKENHRSDLVSKILNLEYGE